MTEAVVPFTLNVPEQAIEDLRSRLAHTRWPDREVVQDWSQGAPLTRVQALCDYWANRYDWRRCEARLNALGQFRTTIDGLGIHFLHVRSPNPDAMPLLLTHGWPGSVVEFLDVAGPLSDPVNHGGAASDAFHLVIPSLPGYGFSDKPTTVGWGVERIAEAWIVLMKRLGYGRFVAQGGDWGAAVTTAIGAINPPECAGIHLNMPIVQPPSGETDLTEREKTAMASLAVFYDRETGYSKQQGTKPQTLGYGLTDSPAGQAAWIYEKFHAWTDNDGTPESAVDLDRLLDNIMLYWLTASATSSARLYWESLTSSFNGRSLDLPVGVTIFPKEIMRPSRRLAERRFSNIIHWNEVSAGGHFAALEEPDVFVSELRECFRPLR